MKKFLVSMAMALICFPICGQVGNKPMPSQKTDFNEKNVMSFPEMLTPESWGCKSGDLGFLVHDNIITPDLRFVEADQQTYQFPQKADGNRIVAWVCSTPRIKTK